MRRTGSEHAVGVIGHMSQYAIAAAMTMKCPRNLASLEDSGSPRSSVLDQLTRVSQKLGIFEGLSPSVEPKPHEGECRAQENDPFQDRHTRSENEVKE